MSLKPFQKIIEPGVLYSVNVQSLSNLNRSLQLGTQLKPTIESFGGQAVDVYVSQMRPSSGRENMTLLFDNMVGLKAFDFVANYLYIELTGTAPEAIVISGLKADGDYLMSAAVEAVTYVAAPLAID